MNPNPYVHHLGDRDAITQMRQTPGNLRDLIALLTPAQVEQPWEPGKWNTRQIVSHLADCELVFASRIRKTLAEDSPLIQPFDQTQWSLRYEVYDLASAMAMFEATRTWNLKLTENLSPDELARVTIHPERGSLTLKTILETIAGHDRNHLMHVQRVAQDAYIGAI